MWEVPTQNHKQRKPRIIWDRLGGWLPHSTTSFIYIISFDLCEKGLRLIPILQRKKLRPSEGKCLVQGWENIQSDSRTRFFLSHLFLMDPVSCLYWLDSAGLKGRRSAGKRKLRAAWVCIAAGWGRAVHRHSTSEASQNTPPDEASGISVFVKLTAFLLTGKCLYYMATNGWKMQNRSQSSGNFFSL